MTTTVAERALFPVQRSERFPVTSRPTSAELLAGIFEAFERAGIRWTLLHGYNCDADSPPSDIDCLLGAETDLHQLIELIRTECHKRSARILRREGLYFLLSGEQAGSRYFLHLDLAIRCTVGKLCFYEAEEVLNSSRLTGALRAPSVDIEFGAYLTRCIAKRSFTRSKLARLRKLYAADPGGCNHQLYRFWSHSSALTIVAGIGDCDTASLIARTEELRAELLAGAGRIRPTGLVANAFEWMERCIGRLRNPTGLHIVFLGCDGAGKSSLIAATQETFGPVFSKTALYGFAPESVQRVLHGRTRCTNNPHGLQTRSKAVSIARALLYWFPYYLFGYALRHVELLRSTLILNDRHFVDVLVDTKRYRYGGPDWLLQRIWKLIPKPDVIVLLDAPAEVLLARKQETSYAAVSEQRFAYLKLAEALPFARIVRTDRHLPAVLSEVSDVIAEVLEKKTLSLGRNS